MVTMTKIPFHGDVPVHVLLPFSPFSLPVVSENRDDDKGLVLTALQALTLADQLIDCALEILRPNQGPAPSSETYILLWGGQYISISDAFYALFGDTGAFLRDEEKSARINFFIKENGFKAFDEIAERYLRGTFRVPPRQP
jgi:hypothetical protein